MLDINYASLCSISLSQWFSCFLIFVVEINPYCFLNSYFYTNALVEVLESNYSYR